MRNLVNIAVTIGLVLISTAYSIAQCDGVEPGTITVSASGFESNTGYSQTYALVDTNSGLIVDVQSSGSFSGINWGTYAIYALNYEGAAPNLLDTDTAWSKVETYSMDAVNCMAIIGPRYFTICTPVCYQDSSIVGTTSGFTATSGYSQTYVLVNPNDSIYGSNTVGSFSFADYADSGVYQLYAVNTNDAAVSAEITDEGLWTDIPVMSGCLNYIGARLYHVSLSYCSVPTSINQLELFGNVQKDHNALSVTYKEAIEVKRTIVYRTNAQGNLETVYQTDGHLKNDEYKDYDFDFYTNHVYRVDQILVNGQVSKSNPISINREADLDIIGVFPVPSNDNVNIHFNAKSAKNGNIRIIDMMGRPVMNKPISTIKGLNQYQLEVHNIESGIYHLVVENEGNRVYKQLVIQH